MKDKRIKKIINNMIFHGVDQILVTSTATIFYLLGDWIESGERMLALYINSNGSIKLFINQLFPIEAKANVDIIVYNDKEDPIKYLLEVIDVNKTLGIDKGWPSGFLIRLLETNKNLKILNGSIITDEVRMIKDEKEIVLMKTISNINDLAINDVIKNIKAEKSEIQISKELAGIYEFHGAEGFSFDPLIAYGKNAAKPHHSSNQTLPLAGDSIILDIGGRKDFYCSDMTRTVFYKSCNEEYKKVYNIVLEANLKAIETIKPGVTFAEIDRAARKVIEKEGYGDYITHRTGHNIGIEVHEYPDVSSINEMVVKPGMIFSVEPGIYLTNKFGVRIEDLVLVTKDACEILNKYSKEIQIV